ncbi:MAG TPA: hypothetical protein VLE96_06170 [Chlamydiales bacterium]|nr:hypothetical protein [Chlamydiales bacterium]
MGIGRGTVKLLIQEALRKPFQGKVLTLGKQDVSITQKQLESIAAQFRFSLHPVPGIDPLSIKKESRAKGFISDVYLLARLGFSDCKSMDYSGYEGCDYVFDLNEPNPLTDLVNAFDVIIDGGTIEHVFHLPNVLRNLFLMTRKGGRIIHASPSSNHMDHGFYMFSPTLFWDYYQANRFEMNQFKIIRHNPWHDIPWEIWDYTPGCLNSVSYGGLDGGMYAIHCVVTKTEDSSAHIIPQQRNYLEGAWKGNEVVSSRRLLAGIKEKIKKNRFLYRVLSPLAPFFRPRKGIKFKSVAKY